MTPASQLAAAAPAAPASVFPVLDTASEGGDEITRLIWLVFGISAVIFVSTGGLIVGAMVRSARRAGPHEAPCPEGGATHPYREFWWMLGPVFVAAWLCFVSVQVMGALAVSTEPDRPDDASGQTPEPHPYDLRVVGRQWFWEFRYPGGAGGAEVVTANELHIPTGTKLTLKVNAEDVVHSFWVPRLGRKIDAIPGWDNYMVLSADEPGRYQGYCSEFCGDQHAWMLFEVVAHEPADYQAWLAAQREAPAAPAPGAVRAAAGGGGGGDAEPPTAAGTPDDLAGRIAAGRAVYESRTCVTCHSIGDPGGSHAGPDLTHLASRGTLAGGVLPLDRPNLRAWMRDPQAVKPGTHMPTFAFSPEELEHVTDYLMSLK